MEAGKGETLQTKFPQSSTLTHASESGKLLPFSMNTAPDLRILLRDGNSKYWGSHHAQLREEELREMREPLDKQSHEKKKRRKKKRRQKGEQLRGLRRSGIPSASSSGGTGADVHTSLTGSVLLDSTIIAPSASEEAPSLRVEAGKVSSNEIGPIIESTSRLETLSLNDLPPAFDSTIGDVVHASDVDGGLPDSVMAPSAEEAVTPRTAELLRELEDYFKEHTFDTTEDLFGFLCNSDRAARAKDQTEQPSLDKFESQPVFDPDQAPPVLAPEEARPAAEGQFVEASKEEIVRNGNQWMIEEVMVAFQKYRERKDDLKDCDYKFAELHNQCFSVENYNHIFHHFNFTVMMKTAGSADWTSVLYFAEVKEIFGHKIYFCCPLEPEENGRCFACKNQRIDDLKHPIIGAFDRGSPDSTFPFIYDSASDDDVSTEADGYDENWIMRMRAAGAMVG